MKHLTVSAVPGSPQPAWTCPACGSAPQVPQPGPPLPDRAALLLDWLAENHQAPGLRVGDIAAAAGISARRLQAICKQHFSRTPIQLLADIRMHHAHTALTGPGPAPASIADAARIAGINRTSRFRAAYRNRYGTAPVITPRIRND
jgi:AraC-like DNA-binding protein